MVAWRQSNVAIWNKIALAQQLLTVIITAFANGKVPSVSPPAAIHVIHWHRANNKFRTSRLMLP